MSKKIFIYSLLIFIFAVAQLQAANVYIDPNCANDGDGNHNGGACAAGGGQTGPWNTYTSKTFSSGNAYRTKCGTTATSVNIDLTATNIVIGSYYDSGGSPVHEDDNPSMGATCGNAAAKPILQGAGNTTILSIDATSTGTKISSVQIKNSGSASAAIQVRQSDDVIIEYNVLGDTCQYGIKVALGSGNDADDGFIRYNIIDSNAYGSLAKDGIQITYGDGWKVYSNKFDDWDHSTIGLYETASNNEFYDNYIEDTQQLSSEAFGFSPLGTGNKYHHNYSKNAGSLIIVGTNNELYNNVLDGCQSGDSLADDAAIKVTNNAGSSTTGNKIYNNTLYGSGNGADQILIVTVAGVSGDHDGDPSNTTVYEDTRGWSFDYDMSLNDGIIYNLTDGSSCTVTSSTYSGYIICSAGLTGGSDNTWELNDSYLMQWGGDTSGNYFRNNIGLNSERDFIRIKDNNTAEDVIGKNYFDNNLGYDFAGYYANVEAETCTTAAQFDAESCDAADLLDASGHLDVDPSLANVGASQFWPDASGDAVVNSGYSVGMAYNTYLTQLSDFTLDPPYVHTQIEETHDIGAYTLYVLPPDPESEVFSMELEDFEGDDPTWTSTTGSEDCTPDAAGDYCDDYTAAPGPLKDSQSLIMRGGITDAKIIQDLGSELNNHCVDYWFLTTDATASYSLAMANAGTTIWYSYLDSTGKLEVYLDAGGAGSSCQDGPTITADTNWHIRICWDRATNSADGEIKLYASTSDTDFDDNAPDKACENRSLGNTSPSQVLWWAGATGTGDVLYDNTSIWEPVELDFRAIRGITIN